MHAFNQLFFYDINFIFLIFEFNLYIILLFYLLIVNIIKIDDEVSYIIIVIFYIKDDNEFFHVKRRKLQFNL